MLKYDLNYDIMSPKLQNARDLKLGFDVSVICHCPICEIDYRFTLPLEALRLRKLLLRCVFQLTKL